MAVKKTRSNQNKKVGGSKSAARNFADKGDFGIPVDQAQAGGAEEVEGRETDRRPLMSGSQGSRVHGVGSPQRGKPGSGSGGDVDTDIIGLDGSGGGTGASGEIGRTKGPDIVPENESE